MREKSEMQSHLSDHMCRLEAPSRNVESEPENVLNTASPGRTSSWILANELMSTPDRPTTSGLQSPAGVPMQSGPLLLLKSIVVKVHAEYLQFNGGITLLENPEKKNANCLEIHLLMRRNHSNLTQHRTRRTRMNLTLQQLPVPAVLVRPIYWSKLHKR